jgi:aspartyl/asparaginyl-tRNA synthetase
MYVYETINSTSYHQAVKTMRAFFEKKGFIEVAAQPRLSILAACEDPSTISSFNYSGQVWPLKQTGQMDLEVELLKNKDFEGVFCQSTSYRQEANPIPGRHDLIFPMFEFEARGGMEELINMEIELLEFIGFKKEGDLQGQGNFVRQNEYLQYDYDDLANMYGVKELKAEHETKMNDEISPVVFIKNFPEHTSPFWNMKRNDTGSHSNKVDVILYGMETIGSAEREIDADIMLNRFHTISDGGYADLLYAQFGKARVQKELESFLSLEMTPRFGGGIGVTRMIRAMKQAGIIA